MKRSLYVFALYFLVGGAEVYGSDKVRLSDDLLRRFTPFHEATGLSGKPVPDIELFKQKGRIFIGRVDTYGLNRYYWVDNNAHVEKLARGVYNGGGVRVDWLCCDLAEEESPVLMRSEGSDYATLLIANVSDKDDEKIN